MTPTTTRRIATREEWLAERLDLLQAEKDLTKRSDQLARRRQALPWVLVEKPYRFDTEEGTASLADLFRGRSQLLVYHFMFGPDYEAGCPSCSSIADGFNGIAVHLANHDVMLCAISRAPLPKLRAYKERMGWTFPWASSFGSDFNFDFTVSFTKDQQAQGAEYNFSNLDPEPQNEQGLQGEDPASWGSVFAKSCGTDRSTYLRELPGVSAFVRDNDTVYHTYSAYARGVDGLWATYQWLDRAPFGRNESLDQAPWLRRHDEYGLRP